MKKNCDHMCQTQVKLENIILLDVKNLFYRFQKFDLNIDTPSCVLLVETSQCYEVRKYIETGLKEIILLKNCRFIMNARRETWIAKPRGPFPLKKMLL